MTKTYKYKLKKHKINKFKKHKHKNNKSKKLKAGSTIYNDGDFIKTEDTYNGNQFFRKIFYYSKPPTEKQKQVVNAENRIVNILMEHPHPNIVTYYDVNKRYVDMEELHPINIGDVNKSVLIETMTKVKDFLQKLGIMYIDWKIDNIGVSKDGKYKLFDFDSSGIVDLKTNKWILEPADFWSYREAKKNARVTPQQIDDWSFDYNILSK